MMEKPIYVGESSFESMVEENAYLVDKTHYIKSIFKDGNSVSLITRPRRFGKSLTQSMLKNFLELDYKTPGDTTKPQRLFSGFEILKDEAFCQENLGQWPVIFLSLKKVEGDDYATARRRLVSTVVDCAQSLDFLLESPKVKRSTKSNLTNLLSLKALPAEEQEDLVSDSLQMLVNALYEAYGRRVVVLVDEYDVPLNKARTFGYYTDMRNLVRQMLGNALKDNPRLKKAVVTGCLRIAKESIFTGFNNFGCHSIGSTTLSGVCGFTPEEAHTVLQDFGLLAFEDGTREHYDGYRFGRTEIYCPWDLLSFCRDKTANGAATDSADKTTYPHYWVNTSSNDIVDEFVRYADESHLRILKALMSGKTVAAPVIEELSFSELDADHSSEKLLSLLYAAGYLTSAGTDTDGNVILRLPNEEIRDCFKRRITASFDKKGASTMSAGQSVTEALFAGRPFQAGERVSEYLSRAMSVRDGGSEAFYHGLILGLFNCEESCLSSNREAGNGYPDIVLTDSKRGIGVILELKKAAAADETTLATACETGLRQILERKYYAPFIGTEIQTVRLYGAAFCGKNCRIIERSFKTSDLKR